MNFLKTVGWAAMAATALIALVAPGTASATILEVEGKPKNEQLTITASLKSGTTALLEATESFTWNTCTTSHLHGNTQSPYTAEAVTGPITSLSFGNCERTVTVHTPGKLEIVWTSGTNGTVYSEEAEVTSGSVFGHLNCKTGETKHIGTLTGVAEGHATLDVNAQLTCSGISTRWTATYTVTTPTGLGTISRATTLEVGGEAKNEQLTITSSLESGTTALLEDTYGFTENTCTTSHVHGNTQSPYTGEVVTGPITSLSFSSCERTVTVHKPGKLEVVWTSATNGTVYSEEAEVTSGTPFGHLNCKTTTTKLGTLTGVAEGHATLDVNAQLSCSGNSTRWTATYTVTSPTGLGVTT